MKKDMVTIMNTIRDFPGAHLKDSKGILITIAKPVIQ